MKHIVVQDKWKEKHLFDCVYKHYLKRNKLYIYSKANNNKSIFIFNLSYVSIVSITDEIIKG